MNTEIKFGSDGWRGELAVGFSVAHLSCICEALFAVLESINKPRILIGFDRRFMADIFAHNLAKMWTILGGEALVTDRFLPSPVLSWYTKADEFDMGIMLTASHNPPKYLGIKLKDSFGSSATPEFQKAISVCATKLLGNADRNNSFTRNLSTFDPTYRHKGTFKTIERYTNAVVNEFADLKRKSLGKHLPRIIIDYMFGAASEIASTVFKELEIETETLRTGTDPTFGGTGPEPTPERLSELKERIIDADGNAIGIAFDGDGDRLTAIDESGCALLSSELFTLHMRHIYRYREEKGKAVGTVSFSRMVEFAARDLDIEYVQVPVGFKSVASEFRNGGVSIGGEESGGTGFNFWLPDRDAIVMTLVLLETIARQNQNLSEMKCELSRLYGPFNFKTKNVPLRRTITYSELDNALDTINNSLGASIRSVDRVDGRKLILSDSSWILIRLSGTEPIVRLYAECETETGAIELLIAGEVFIKRLIGSQEGGL